MHSHLGSGGAEQRAGSRDADGRYTRIGYVLRRCGIERHCGVVSRICLPRGGRRGDKTTAVTAARDGTLKCWDFEPCETEGGSTSSTTGVPRLRCSFEEHTGWVNDAVVLPLAASGVADGDSRRAISASNDNLIKIWNIEQQENDTGVSGALLSLRYHSDYVTCLTYAPNVGLLASAGLDSRIVVSDLEAATRVLTLGPAEESEPHGSYVRRGNSAHRGSAQYVPLVLAPMRSKDGSGRGSASAGASVWSLAMTRNASLLVSGAASSALRLWDPRSGSQHWRLRPGHTDNVRAVALSEDGTICLSASTDRTVRLWDIGMRRCVHVFEDHLDSVWSLAVAGSSCGYIGTSLSGGGAGGAMGKVFSGGRDGLVLSYDLRRLRSSLAVEEPWPIQGLAASADGEDIWTSTNDSHVRVHTPQYVPVSQAAVITGESLPPRPEDDNIVVEGTPRLVEYRVLHNKRQILVRDVCNKLALWDVTNGQCLDLPALEPDPEAVLPDDGLMKKMLARVDKKISVPNWFSCDLTLGSLSVYLDMSQCFRAESEDVDVVQPSDVYAGDVAEQAADVHMRDVSAGGTVNLGAKTLRTLFDSWVRSPGAGSSRAGAERGVSTDGLASGITAVAAAAGVRLHVAGGGLPTASLHEKSEWVPPEQLLGTPVDPVGCSSERLPGGPGAQEAFPASTRLLLVGRGTNRISAYRGKLFSGLLSGSEAPELLPSWAVDVVWRQKPPPEELCGERTMLFSLVKQPVCAPAQVLPSLQTPYYMGAPRMRVRQIMEYLIQALVFDWSSPPAKGTARRPSSAASFVSRLGRCCVAPSSARGRAGSGDSWSSQSDGYESRGPSSADQKRSRGGSRDRRNRGGGKSAGASSASYSSGAAADGVSSARRPFAVRRGEGETLVSGNGIANRIRIEAEVHAQRGGVGSSKGTSLVGEEQCVEILCNDEPLDPDMTLATVRDFIWKRNSVELVMHYRRAAPGASTPLPVPPPPPLLPSSSGGVKETNSVHGESRSAAEVLNADFQLHSADEYPNGHPDEMRDFGFQGQDLGVDGTIASAMPKE